MVTENSVVSVTFSIYHYNEKTIAEMMGGFWHVIGQNSLVIHCTNLQSHSSQSHLGPVKDTAPEETL